MTNKNDLKEAIDWALQQDTLSGVAVGKILLWELARERQGQKPVATQKQLDEMQKRINTNMQKDVYSVYAALYRLLIAAFNRSGLQEQYFKGCFAITQQTLIDCLNWERLSKAYPDIAARNKMLDNGDGAIFTGYTLDRLIQDDNHLDIPYYRQVIEDSLRKLYAFDAMLDILSEVYQVPALTDMKLDVNLSIHLEAQKEAKRLLRAEVAGTYKEAALDTFFPPLDAKKYKPLKRNITRVKKKLEAATLGETMHFFGFSLAESIIPILTGDKQ